MRILMLLLALFTNFIFANMVVANVTITNEAINEAPTRDTITALIEKAQQNDKIAQYQLAMAYRSGQDTPPSEHESLYWLKQAASNGSKPAAFELANQYLNGKESQENTELGIYWLTTLALQGDSNAQFQLGQWFEKSNVPVSAHDLASVWYQISAPTNQDASNAYDRLLEAQFNAQRAKRIAAMNKLDSQEIETSNVLNDALPSEALLNEKQTVLSKPEILSIDLSGLNLPASALTIEAKDNALMLLGVTCSALSLFSFALWRKLSRFTKSSSQLFSSSASLTREPLSRRAGISSNNDRQGELQNHYEEQIKIRDKKLQKQKQQLDALYQAFKTQQNENAHNKRGMERDYSGDLTHACAMFGFDAKLIPDQKEIKTRYKQLSKVYHPDRLGSQEEMKRLNQALKTISTHVNK
ncbi:J domain-containing protein [Vibrio sinensis]|uniref:J domain-containing protein n=1 Tax=Vibrio sinensis TaxID=2302434 RepID=UPI001402955B|nr:J domain-containing protein [Vibrio sinensis]